MKVSTTTINPEILRYIRYLSFKADCLREQSENPLTIDRAKTTKYKEQLESLVEEKLKDLTEVMPKVPVEYTAPKVYKKQDGTLSVHGLKWEQTLREHKQPSGTVRFFEYIDGNPKSDPQLKAWLDSLGWKPCTYKFQRNKVTGEEKKIPQVRYFSPNDPRKGELTDSIKALMDTEPALEALDGLTMSTHRLNIFKALLTHSDEAGQCVASAGGFTNTLRFKHRNPFVNLPKADGEVPWGVEIRSCIIAPEGVCGACGGNKWVTSYSAMAYDGEIECPKCKGTGKISMEMCGSDVVSLESSTKRHFMWPHDPEYADAMGAEGFDEHLDLSVFAGALTQEEIDTKGPKHPDIKPIRKQYKATNYSAIYGVGPPKLARELFIKEWQAAQLLEAYWERNKSIKKVAKEQYIKKLKDGSLWLKNPVSGFYYSLRYERDVFSTLNQGTGVFIFDSWLMRVRKKGVVIPFQYHDELMTLRNVQTQAREEIETALHEGMKEVNESLKLNVEVKVDVQWGSDYASVH